MIEQVLALIKDDLSHLESLSAAERIEQEATDLYTKHLGLLLKVDERNRDAEDLDKIDAMSPEDMEALLPEAQAVVKAEIKAEKRARKAREK